MIRCCATKQTIVKCWFVFFSSPNIWNCSPKFCLIFRFRSLNLEKKNTQKYFDFNPMEFLAAILFCPNQTNTNEKDVTQSHRGLAALATETVAAGHQVISIVRNVTVGLDVLLGRKCVGHLPRSAVPHSVWTHDRHLCHKSAKQFPSENLLY